MKAQAGKTGKAGAAASKAKARLAVVVGRGPSYQKINQANTRKKQQAQRAAKPGPTRPKNK